MTIGDDLLGYHNNNMFVKCHDKFVQENFGAGLWTTWFGHNFTFCLITLRTNRWKETGYERCETCQYENALKVSQNQTRPSSLTSLQDVDPLSCLQQLISRDTTAGTTTTITTATFHFCLTNHFSAVILQYFLFVA